MLRWETEAGVRRESREVESLSEVRWAESARMARMGLDEM